MVTTVRRCLRIGGVLAALAMAATMVTPTAARADVVRDGQWYLGPMGITAAHKISDGRGVRVAVVDSGVDGAAQDLRGAVVAGKDFSGEGSPNGQGVIDDDDHGTHVASVLGARGHGAGNGDGVIGSAPGAGIVSASVSVGGANNVQQTAAALRWSADQGVEVISLSIEAGQAPAEVAALRYAESKDIVIVAASGNGRAAAGSPPCGLPGVVCVGGVDKNLKHDAIANTDSSLAVVGPFATVAGADKSTNTRAGLPVVNPTSRLTPYTGAIGTSFSAPVVAGVVALIRAKYPDLDAANVINRLIRTAKPLGGTQPNPTYGWGLPDAEKALTANVAPVTANPFGSLVGGSPSSGPASSATTPGTGKPASSSPVIGAADDSSGSSTGVIVGVVVAVVVVAGVVAYLLVRRRTPRRLTS